jgi:glycosyltransferase involved in cell wall biosynthesis
MWTAIITRRLGRGRTSRTTNVTTPHLLYVAWGFPPSRAGGVYRALATVNAFAAAGWRVTVVTADRDTYTRFTGADPSLEARVAAGVEVVRVPFTWPAQDPDVRRYSWLRVVAPPVWARLRCRLDRLTFPEASYGPWRRALSKAVADVHRRTPVDLAIATANPHVTFAAVHDLWRHARVPYVMDYRDAWRLDVFSGAETASARSRVGRWEARLVADAAEVWFVNEPIRRWHAERYASAADRLHVVANGWDPDLLDVPVPRRALVDGAPVRFAYLGTVTPKVPVAELVEGWRLALADGLVPPSSTLTIGGHLGYFAVPQGQLADLVTGSSDAGVRYVGPVPKTRVGEFYAESDVLVLALGSGRYVTSGKVYEYVATSRPIVAVHAADNATSSVLAGDPALARARDVSARGVADALAAGALLAREDRAPEAEKLLARLSHEARRDAQLEPRVAALTRAVTR